MKMNSTCYVTANSEVIISFFSIGFILAIGGTLLNFYSCLLFSRTKSLFNTPYAIFIIGLSIADIIKLVAEYYLHLLFIFIQHSYFVCSITWFLTMTSENTSYAFLCALGNLFFHEIDAVIRVLFLVGIERNLKVWTTGRRWLITRQRACYITLFIVLFFILYDHPFLYWPVEASYCYFTLFNYTAIYTCNNAYYHVYGYSFSLTKLLLIENIGLNNMILPLIIILTNIVLIIGLRRRSYQRRLHLGRNKSDGWRERSVLIYMLLSSVIFIFLTLPVGILVAWGIGIGVYMPTNNLVLIGDLMEILHHCSHFPILLMTSSRIRRKLLDLHQQPKSTPTRSRTTRSRSRT